MKKILLAFLMLTIFAAKAQTNVYYPLPDTNTVWSVSAYKYIVKGDSVYNFKTYKKYYITSDTNLSISSFQYIGMIKQDIANKKVYGVAAYQTTENIIYDFNLNINDTITVYPIDGVCYGHHFLIVSALDSILINGSYRKRISFGSSLGTIPDHWIEGVGSDYGPLSPGLNPFCVTDACWPILLCMKQNGILMYQNPQYNTCYFDCGGVGIRQVAVSSLQLTVYPNPVQNSLQVTVNNEQIKEVKIYDVLGKQVKNEELKTNNIVQIDVNNLPNGVYSIQVKTGVNMYTKKIIVQH